MRLEDGIVNDRMRRVLWTCLILSQIPLWIDFAVFGREWGPLSGEACLATVILLLTYFLVYPLTRTYQTMLKEG